MRTSNGGYGNHGHSVGNTNTIRITSVLFRHPVNQRLTTSVSKEYTNTTTSLTEAKISLEIKSFLVPTAETASDGSRDLSLVLGLVGGLAILFCAVVMSIIWYQRRTGVGHEPKACVENSVYDNKDCETSVNEYAAIQDGYDSLCFKEKKIGHEESHTEYSAASTDVEEIKRLSDTFGIYEPVEKVKERRTIDNSEELGHRHHYSNFEHGFHLTMKEQQQTSEKQWVRQ